MGITEQILSIAGACIISAGGIGAIVLGVIRLASNSIATSLSKKYEIKLNKELEQYKAGLENKIYISKTKFDAEFCIYRQLSKLFTTMVVDVSCLFPIFTKNIPDSHEYYRSLHDNAYNAIVAAQDELYSNAAFMSKEMYKDFFNLHKLCITQLSEFQDLRLQPAPLFYDINHENRITDAHKKTKEIEEKFDLLLENLREYISRLDVIE